MNYKLSIKLIIVMLCITCIFVSCNQEKKENKEIKKPFSEINLANGNLKVYFFNMPYDYSNQFPKSDFQSKYGNFYISDKIALQKIKDEIIMDRAYLSNFSINYYLVNANYNNELVSLGMLETENCFFWDYDKKFYFNLDEFENLKDFFIPLYSYNVYCKTISNSNAFFDFMQTSEGFLYTYDQENPYAEYNGFVELYVAMEGCGWECVEDKLEKDFANVGEVSFTQATYYTKDSAIIKMFWKNDYTDKLPAEYTICKPYSDSISFAFTVFDIHKDSINMFFKREDIDGYEIKENI